MFLLNISFSLSFSFQQCSKCKHGMFYPVIFSYLKSLLSSKVVLILIALFWLCRFLLDVSGWLEDSWEWVLRVQSLQREPRHSESEPAGPGQRGPQEIPVLLWEGKTKNDQSKINLFGGRRKKDRPKATLI